MITKLLFPNRYKRVGWIIFIPTTIFGLILLFSNSTFGFPGSKVFTIYSDPLSTKGPIIFGLTYGNYLHTIVGVLFLIGAILVAFSKLKQEDEFIAKVRHESLVWATYVNYAVLIFCFLFFFFMEFYMVMVFNMFTILIFFIIRFHYILYKSKRSLGYEKQS